MIHCMEWENVLITGGGANGKENGFSKRTIPEDDEVQNNKSGINKIGYIFLVSCFFGSTLYNKSNKRQYR